MSIATWSKTPPTAEEVNARRVPFKMAPYWWWRSEPLCPAHALFLRVSKDGKVSAVNSILELDGKPVDCMGGEWGGPVPTPDEVSARDEEIARLTQERNALRADLARESARAEAMGAALAQLCHRATTTAQYLADANDILRNEFRDDEEDCDDTARQVDECRDAVAACQPRALDRAAAVLTAARDEAARHSNAPTYKAAKMQCPCGFCELVRALDAKEPS